jgi:hypothetical protein
MANVTRYNPTVLIETVNPDIVEYVVLTETFVIEVLVPVLPILVSCLWSLRDAAVSVPGVPLMVLATERGEIDDRGVFVAPSSIPSSLLAKVVDMNPVTLAVASPGDECLWSALDAVVPVPTNPVSDDVEMGTGDVDESGVFVAPVATPSSLLLSPVAMNPATDVVAAACAWLSGA